MTKPEYTQKQRQISIEKLVIQNLVETDFTGLKMPEKATHINRI